jgi:ATP-binding cassette subfamily B multidrug efflux pump
MMKLSSIHNPDKIINYWKKEKVSVAFIIIFGFGFNSAAVLSPIYQGKLIDAIANEAKINKLIQLGLTFVGLIAMIQFMRYLKRLYIRRFANSTSATMRLMIYNNIMNKSLLELEDENTGSLMTKAVSDVELCVEGMRKFTTEIFDTGVLIATYFITMLFYDIRITILASLFVPIAMLIAEKLKAIIFKNVIAYRKHTSKVTGLTYDRIENAIIYRISGMEEMNQKEYKSYLEDLQEKAIKAHILENSMQPIYNVIAMLGIILVISIGGANVIDGSWSLGEFSTYVIIFTAMAFKASKAAKLFNSVQKSQVSWKRIKPYLTEYSSKDTTSNIESKKVRLDISKLSFSYPNGMNDILIDISLNATAGDIIGITGPIASGKSTFGIVLLGVYPYSGSIRIDSKELSEYTEYERSQLISYLGHQPHLISDTIYNNIVLGNDGNIDEVIKTVCFEKDLEQMEKGLETKVGNGGVRLSGGQQARVALARTLYNKNKIIILDDPFSAVDMKTEEQIIQNLKDRFPESIILLISHRLSIFNKVNQIIVIHGDKTVEYGTHEDLIRKSKLYADIYNLQRGEGGDLDEK